MSLRSGGSRNGNGSGSESGAERVMAVIPIQSLSPDTTAPSQASIRAIVTLSWPYSSSTRQCALLLADPDFRLRNARGQVRVRFTGASAEAVAKSHVGIGDEVVLKLEGAHWETAREVDRTPGKSVDGELVYGRRLELRILDGRGEKRISLDAPASPPPAARSAETPASRAVRSLRSSLNDGAYSNGVPIYSSPAFAKRLRLSAESSSFFSDTAYDPFFDDDVDASSGKIKQRRSLGEVRQWRFADRTPSPEKVLGLDGQMDVDRHDTEVTAAVTPETAGLSAINARMMAPPRQTWAHMLEEPPSADIGQSTGRLCDLPSSSPAEATETARSLQKSFSAEQIESSTRIPSLEPTAPTPVMASVETFEGDVPSNTAMSASTQGVSSPITRFSQAHRSYESDTGEDEELYTRTPPRAGSASPLQCRAAQHSASEEHARTPSPQHKPSVVTATHPSPAPRLVQALGSKTKQPAPQKRSSPAPKGSNLPTLTPSKPSVRNVSLGGPSAATTPSHYLGATPQSEKDRVMSATFKSLFGFRTSPEAQPPPSQPVEVATPTPKAGWFDMGRTGLDERAPDIEPKTVDVIGQRVPPAQRDGSLAVEKQFGLTTEPNNMPVVSQPLSSGGTTEADTEADEDFELPESSRFTESQQKQSISRADMGQSVVCDSETTNEDNPSPSTTGQSSVPQSQLPQAIDLDSSESPNGNMTLFDRSVDDSSFALQNVDDDKANQQLDASTGSASTVTGQAHARPSKEARQEDEKPDKRSSHDLMSKEDARLAAEPAQTHRRDVEDETALARHTPERALFTDHIDATMSSHAARAASGLFASPGGSILKPAARDDFQLARFPPERVVEDSQSEQTGTLSTQQTPENVDNGIEAIPVPARQTPASSAQKSHGSGKELAGGQAREIHNADSQKPPDSCVQSTVIELGSSSPAQESQPPDPRPPVLQQPSSPPLGQPQSDDAVDAAQSPLDDLMQPKGIASSPSAAPPGREEDHENQMVDLSSTAPVPSETFVADSSRPSHAALTVADHPAAPSPSQAPANSILETSAGSQAAGMMTGSTDETIIESSKGRPLQRTASPEEVWHLPGGMVATFSNTALFPPNPFDSQLQHEGPNVTPWGETFEGGMDVEAGPNISALASTPQLTQPAGSTTYMDSSLRTSRAGSEVNEVVSNISTELSMEAQLEPEIQAHKQISDKWIASGQRGAAILGLTKEDTDDGISNQPFGLDADAQSREEAEITYSGLPLTEQQVDQREEQKSLDDRSRQVTAPAALHEAGVGHDGNVRAEFIEEESASAAEQRKMPSRKSLRARLSNVPDVISSWFSLKGMPQQSAVNNAKSSGHPEGHRQAEVAASITPPRPMRGHSTGFTTSNGYFTPLANLERHLNPSSQADEVDIIAVVTDFTAAPQRAKGGPRDYYTVLKVSDSSLDVKGTVRVEVFRPWKAVLPVAEVGDVILLRCFVVKSKKRQPYLLSTEGSAWCVWRYAEIVRIESQASGSDKVDNRSHVREEIHGPPVEYGDDERVVARGLRWWFEETYPDAARSQAANSITTTNEDTVVHNEDDDEMAYRPLSPALAAKL